MSEASRRSRVTITLGRSGQVIKRAGPELGDTGNSYELPRAGMKRPVRERLGSGFDSSSLQGSEVSNKRQRGEASLSAHGLQVDKGDLRFKLMQKNAQRGAQRDECSTMDLRAKLSRSEQQPPRSVDTRHRMAEPRNVSGQGQLPPSRTAHSFSRMGSTSNSHSPWTLDHIRRRSPERLMGTPRGLSPPPPPRNANLFPLLILCNIRNAGTYTGLSRVSSPPRGIEEFRGRPLSRAFDDVRASPYTVKSAPNAQPPVNNTPFTPRMALPPPAVKPPLPAFSGRIPPPGTAVQKDPFTAEEHQTVDDLLNSLGLGKYAVLFKAEEVDMTALKQMKESDLKDLTIPMGPRKKILQALAPRPKRP
ncbi:PREDICTED: uncharacterized protein LOC104824671 [Tarenaya hassleriana]|uniref:uncharacterized protein LOC104824671 n=1 Tax=Tarenaya hassleriana TaxID=28532 RepID=UPI00053C1989|nr:PREDICTED: uncharacterized protein LOC104824671 [Tarenaya hassleriana]